MSEIQRDVTVRTNIQLGSVALPDFRAVLQPLKSQLDGIGASISSTVNNLGSLNAAINQTAAQATRSFSTITNSVSSTAGFAGILAIAESSLRPSSSSC